LPLSVSFAFAELALPATFTFGPQIDIRYMWQYK